MDAEQQRLVENATGNAMWHRWGPYLSERQWGTVREDYSANGAAWEYFPHDQARSRAYRWGEDGLGGFSDRHGLVCFALALWNGQDPILKERMFGLTNRQGNHGEDVKDYYFYLDNTPTHSYMKYLYKYPQAEFPYQRLIDENARRTKDDPEFELLDTGIFADNRYFDVIVEYAKADTEDILIRIEVFNRGPEAAPLTVLPTLWFRNTWVWNHSTDPRPQVTNDGGAIKAETQRYGEFWLHTEDKPPLLFTENEINDRRCFNAPNQAPYVKDAFHDYVIHADRSAVNPAQTGTKAAAHYELQIAPGASQVIRMRFCRQQTPPPFGADFDAVFAQRIAEADAFYLAKNPEVNADALAVQRQAFAGLLWSKQFYHYDVRTWLNGDSAMPPPPESRCDGRNAKWTHVYAAEVISMPDAWEYPWFAAWDLAFHCIPLAIVDADFAKQQLLLLLREWYMHPNGQIPAYEWAFSDVNPPVHAWAALRVYQIERRETGKADRMFLVRVFHKLLLNFTWWVNRKDEMGNNVFEGGFLGLDNIGVFDRNIPLPDGTVLEQSDGTSWMAMFCLNMLAIALELAEEDPAYEDVASKFFEHFVYIADALNKMGNAKASLWDEEDGFYYDVLSSADGDTTKLKVRSMVGLIPLFAVHVFDGEVLDKFPSFRRRMNWFLENRPDMTKDIACARAEGQAERRMFAIVPHQRLGRALEKMLSEREFLSPYGLRSVSRYHADHPFLFEMDGQTRDVTYNPAESRTGAFGGNSNWRGPIWFPLNYLLIETLQKFDYFYGEEFKVECPSGSGKSMTLWEVSTELSRRLISLYTKDADGKRAVYGEIAPFQNDPNWRDLLLFHEYFHGDNGAGLGANHQTGWTGLLAKLIQQSGK